MPRPQRRGWRAFLLLALGAILVIASGAYGTYLYVTTNAAARPDLILHSVKKEKLQLTIVERGQLEAANNEDIVCRVKAGSKGSTVATTIKSVIDDGSHVKKGDLLITLDASGLEEQLKTQEIAVNQALAAKVKAEQDYELAVEQGKSDIQTAQTNVDIAELELKKYQEGDLEQKKKDIDGRRLIARSDLEQWRDRVFWSEMMVKGRYISEAQLQADKARLRSAEVALEKVNEELRVLERYESLKEIKRLDNDLRDKRTTLLLKKKEAESKRIQAEAERDAKRKVHEQELARLNDIKEQIKLCEIRAPQDGLVVYYVPEQSRWGGGSRQSIIAQGEPVVEGQKLMRIPNLSNMQVKAKVHEALVSRVRPGQPAKVRVDALPEKEFRGTVKSVATVADQGDWMSTDVKVYVTMVSIDDDVEQYGLKPGMSSAVTIYTDSRTEETPTIPVSAVLGSFDMGRKRKCFVVGPKGPEEREIEIGLSNERMVAVVDGLQEGDQVVTNPRVLLSEKDRKMFGGGDRLLGKDNGPPGGFPKGGGEGTKGGPEGMKGGSRKGGTPGKGGPGDGMGPGGMPPGGMPPGGMPPAGWPGKGGDMGGRGGISKGSAPAEGGKKAAGASQ